MEGREKGEREVGPAAEQRSRSQNVLVFTASLFVHLLCLMLPRLVGLRPSSRPPLGSILRCRVDIGTLGLYIGTKGLY